MDEFEKFKNNIIDIIQSEFKVNKINMNFKEEFYYPKMVHILKFNIEQYEVKNLGNMAILKGKGFALMKMITVVFTPSSKTDIPLLIIDFIKMANKRTVFVEFYSDHITDKENIKKLESKLKELDNKYNNIPNYIEKPNWYTPLRNKYSPLKKTTKKDDSILEKMVLEYLEEYLSYVNNSNSIINEKNPQLETFINDLIYKGNPSTLVLEKALGKEETIKLFKEIIFNYK